MHAAMFSGRSSRRPRQLLGATAVAGLMLASASAWSAASVKPRGAETATPIKHLVVIFQENVSFDHYFGTYPNAANTDGQHFVPSPDTPGVNGLNGPLLTANPNGVNPVRLGGPDQQVTCDQDHTYTDEQLAVDGGAMDGFVAHTNVESCKPPTFSSHGLVMDYYDGNSVTALWNYAQHYAMSDNSYGTTFGPSTPGALNLVSGQTHGIAATATPGTSSLTGEVVNGTVIGDPQPLGDDCSTRDQVQMSGTNIGDLLNTAKVSWGFFEGGFRPTTPANPATGVKAVCGATHPVGAALGHNGDLGTKGDYVPHHEPFQYYATTANPHHLPPTSPAAVGHNDQANHQYDVADFHTALAAGNLPEVSFLKAAAYQDGHPGYSDPIDEQQFLVTEINALQKSPFWKSTAVVIAYDDSDGWYDHQLGPVVNVSHDPNNDGLTGDPKAGTGSCGSAARTPLAGYQDRCGYGPRLPLLVISPFARRNYVDSTVTDQTSILRFIEDNWLDGHRIGDGSFDALAGSLGGMLDFGHPTAKRLLLDPSTGQPLH